jgi:hypothetical protein
VSCAIKEQVPTSRHKGTASAGCFYLWVLCIFLDERRQMSATGASETVNKGALEYKAIFHYSKLYYLILKTMNRKYKTYSINIIRNYKVYASPLSWPINK